MLLRAGTSVVAAIQHWNSQANWPWLLTTATTVSVTSGNSLYALPYDFKDMYLCQLTAGGIPRTLKARDRRNKLNFTPAPVPTTPYEYDLFYKGGQGKIELLPGPDSNATLDMSYYRKMTSPCAITTASVAVTSGSASATIGDPTGVRVGNTLYAGVTAIGAIVSIGAGGGLVLDTTAAYATGTISPASIGGDTTRLDVPEQYETHILSHAAHHFMSSLGVPQDRLSYWINYSQEGLNMALAEVSSQPEDLDFGFGRDPEVKALWYRTRSTRWDGR